MSAQVRYFSLKIQIFPFITLLRHNQMGVANTLFPTLFHPVRAYPDTIFITHAREHTEEEGQGKPPLIT
jgi:hypothetical protein